MAWCVSDIIYKLEKEGIVPIDNVVGDKTPKLPVRKDGQLDGQATNRGENSRQGRLPQFKANVSGRWNA